MTTAPRRRPWPLGRVVAGICVALVLVWVGRRSGVYIPVFRDWVNGLGPWGPVAFILGYAIAVVAFVPAAALTLGAGAIFGLGRGVAYVFVAAVLGSSAAFLVARYGARRAIERRLAGLPRFAAIDRAVAAEGRKIVFLLRLSPAFPFVLLNYALGLTRIRFADYLTAAPGMLPGTLLYVYYGTLGGALAEGADAYRLALLGVGLAATLGVTLVITRTARRALREATGE